MPADNQEPQPREDTDPFTLGGYIPLFEHVAAVDGVTHAHCRMYGVLASFRGKGEGAVCAPRMSAICERFGTAHERNARRLIADLEGFGLIAVDRSGNGQGKPSRYYFLTPDPRVESTPGPERPPGKLDPGVKDARGPRVEMTRGPRVKSARSLKTSQRNLSEKRGERARAQPPQRPELEPGEPEASEAERVRLPELVRLRFSERFLEKTTCSPPTTPRQVENYRAIAAWLEQSGGDPERTLGALLDGFFGDEWAADKRFPIAALANNPPRYLAAPGQAPGAPARQLSPLALKAIEEQQRLEREQAQELEDVERLKRAVREESIARGVTPQHASAAQWRDGCQTVRDAMQIGLYPDALSAARAFAVALVDACEDGEKLGFALQQVQLSAPPAPAPEEKPRGWC